jgi:hypothetical protein
VIDRWASAGATVDGRFAGIVVDAEPGVVRIYRTRPSKDPGARPARDLGAAGAAEAGELAARRLVSGLERAGLEVLVLPAASTRRQLEAAQEVLAASDAFAARGVRSVGIADDGSGLVVRAVDPGPALERALRAAVPVAVTLRRGDVRVATRWSDSPPFYAGAGTEHPKGTDWCSTGFAVTDRPGRHYLSTAAHCDRVRGPAWYTGDGSRRIGAMSWEGSRKGVDIGLVPARTAGYVFDGPWNDTRGYAKPVAGWSGVSAGMLLCASGAWSGVVCDLRVVEADDTMRVNGHVVHGAWVEQRHGKALWGLGDSGGPVFGLTGDGEGDIAVGLVSAIDATRAATCQGRSARDRGGPCAAAGMIAPMSRLRAALGAVVLTAR